MRLWTIQTYEAWQSLQELKVLYGYRERVYKGFLPAYEWLCTQMEQRTGPRPYSDAFPIWAWYRWHGRAHPKPDLRSGGFASPGSRCVRLEIEISEERVLLSDFDLWHYVLNRWYLSENEEKDTAFEVEYAKCGLSFHDVFAHPNFHARILKSWDHIFDMGLKDEFGYHVSASLEERRIQATFWELSLEDVKRADIFIARGQKVKF